MAQYSLFFKGIVRSKYICCLKHFLCYNINENKSQPYWKHSSSANIVDIFVEALTYGSHQNKRLNDMRWNQRQPNLEIESISDGDISGSNRPVIWVSMKTLDLFME